MPALGSSCCAASRACTGGQPGYAMRSAAWPPCAARAASGHSLCQGSTGAACAARQRRPGARAPASKASGPAKPLRRRTSRSRRGCVASSAARTSYARRSTTRVRPGPPAPSAAGRAGTPGRCGTAVARVLCRHSWASRAWPCELLAGRRGLLLQRVFPPRLGLSQVTCREGVLLIRRWLVWLSAMAETASCADSA